MQILKERKLKVLLMPLKNIAKYKEQIDHLVFDFD